MIERSSEMNPNFARKILRGALSTDKAFYFFKDIGQYTGNFALNLEEFYGMMDKVPLQSLEFHFLRGDFERWIREVLGDVYLADRISSIDKSFRAKKLRAMLKRKVRRRINQLKKMLEK